MRAEYNIYCDESCHLVHNTGNVMALGALSCPKSKCYDTFSRLREIKVQAGLKKNFEVKWNKISPAKHDFYLNLIDYFFNDDNLHYRALILPNKSKLNSADSYQDYNTFYYKMYFDLLGVMLSPDCTYNIYIDIKDSRSQKKVIELKNILRNSHYDFDGKIIKKIQQVHSHEIELMQITDLLTGAISYLHRGLHENIGKTKVIERIKKRSGYSLLKPTLIKEEKMNIHILTE
jgi:hypothetical protein